MSFTNEGSRCANEGSFLVSDSQLVTRFLTAAELPVVALLTRATTTVRAFFLNALRDRLDGNCSRSPSSETREFLCYFVQPDAQHSAGIGHLSWRALGKASDGWVRAAPTAEEQALRGFHAWSLHEPGDATHGLHVGPSCNKVHACTRHGSKSSAGDSHFGNNSNSCNRLISQTLPLSPRCLR